MKRYTPTDGDVRRGCKLSEHEANEVMADIENREIVHRENPSAEFDCLLRHLYELHKMRDERTHCEIIKHPSAFGWEAKLFDMKTFGESK